MTIIRQLACLVLLLGLSPTAGATVHAATTGSAETLPELTLWMVAPDTGPLTQDSRVAFYLRGSIDGYLSLYHFDTGRRVQRLFPEAVRTGAPLPDDSFVRAGVTYRLPAQGFLTLRGSPGEGLVKGVLTRTASGIVAHGDTLDYRTPPLAIIPLTTPVTFANRDLSRFFPLPRSRYAETHLRYRIHAFTPPHEEAE